MKKIKLESKLVGDIKGEFVVSAYQRGYRWNEEVAFLLNDINEIEEGRDYCLQPIVLKKIADDRFELIDGQQRLTTIYLLFRYMKQLNLPFQLHFSLEYQIRKETKMFLEQIQVDTPRDQARSMDEYFILSAYQTISTWFKTQRDEALAAFNLYKKLNERIHVIWYEVDSSENPVSLFTRLNIGRIPLTNAELVKALFLSKNNGIDERRQLEIATSWDTIEKELHNGSFWSFITNESGMLYPTRIELLFDLMANKPRDEREKFFTFFHFDRQIRQGRDKSQIWTDILRYYQRLKEWYENNDLYHKIGYLVASNSVRLQDLANESLTKTKTAFHNSLDKLIATSIDFRRDYCELSYERKGDYEAIKSLLLLFNVETVRQRSDETMRFPFEKHKEENWSLEHIHAQEQEGLNKKEQWVEWLDLHKKSLLGLGLEADSGIIRDITAAIADEKLSGDTFGALFDRVNSILSEEGSMEYMHSLANLALLGQASNSALSNSTFAVKRDRILAMDKSSDYIPICTRHVFLKYYTPSEANKVHFWGEADRVGYIAEMNRALKNYLALIQKEVTV